MAVEGLLAAADAALKGRLSPGLVDKLATLDAWGAKSIGVPYTGTIISLALVVLLLLVTCSLLAGGVSKGAVRVGARKNANTIILLGTCGAGKTALFYKILHDAVPETVTSMRESVEGGTLVSEDNGRSVSFRLMDFPGHERLRVDWRKLLIEGALKGVIYVVDAAEFGAQAVRPAAEFLYDVLTEEAMDEGPPVLVACHKADVPGAKAPPRVKALITAELERLRKTRGASTQLDDGNDTENTRVPLGRTGQPLNLDVDAPSEVSVQICMCGVWYVLCVCIFWGGEGWWHGFCVCL
nr:SRb [Vischeria sp. CAUP Q 202]